VPIDVSEHLLRDTHRLVESLRDGACVKPLLADFMGEFSLPPNTPGGRLGFFPGSTIGNLLPAEALEFLSRSREVLGDDSQLLIGTDLVKPVDILEAAYDDAAGVTERFNKNLLRRINRELNANFKLDAFYHRSFYDPAFQRIEMHLVSDRDQEVSIAGTRRIRFRRGESIHTENSHKFTVEGFRSLAWQAGWRPMQHWVDERGWFAVHLLGST
jgi:dimethylhistidine N-methyltransferase